MEFIQHLMLEVLMRIFWIYDTHFHNVQIPTRQILEFDMYIVDFREVTFLIVFISGEIYINLFRHARNFRLILSHMCVSMCHLRHAMLVKLKCYIRQFHITFTN